MFRLTTLCLLLIFGSSTVAHNVVDLTYDLNEETLYWPAHGAKPFHLDIFFAGSFLNGWAQNDNMETANHLGTHLDAPRHFSKTGWSVSQIPVKRLIAPAVMVDIREQASVNPDTNLTAAILHDWEREHGRIPKGAVVFQCSGWTDKYPDFEAYFGGPRNTTNGASDYHFPGFSLDAAQFLIEERGVVGLAVDTPSIDYGATKTFPTHFYFCEHNVYGLENVKDPCRIPAIGAHVYVATPKSVGASGAPARVLAEWDDHTEALTGQGSPSRSGGMLLWVLLFIAYLF